jgi:DNA/RNA endonuclease YhcR with UshA esterase domain
MRMFLFSLAVLAFAIQLPAGDTNAPALPKTSASALLKIGTADAANHYDQVMIVTGKVAQVTIRPTVTFLNLDKPFPNSPFTVVIFPGTFIPGLKSLEGKSIEIKGKIKNYHDKPEIALDSTNQLTVLGSFQFTNAPVVMPTNAPPAMPATNFPEIM